MKRRMSMVAGLMLVCMLIALVLAPLAPALAERLASSRIAMPVSEGVTFRLPASLLVIEDEAFAGTAAQAVIVPDGAESIGHEAFANDAGLAFIYLPATLTHIADDALRGAPVRAVIGQHGSEAEGWAAQHGYRFIGAQLWAMLMPDRDPLPRPALNLIHEDRADETHPLRPARPDEPGSHPDKRQRPEMRVIDYRFP